MANENTSNKCPACGAPVNFSGGAAPKFCEACGANIEIINNKCPACGAPVSYSGGAASKFCESCGAKLDGSAAGQPAAATAAAAPSQPGKAPDAANAKKSSPVKQALSGTMKNVGREAERAFIRGLFGNKR